LETASEGPARRTRAGGARFGAVLAALNSVGTLWILVLMVVVNADVVGRTALNSPIPGVAEFGRLSIVGIIFLSLAHGLREGRITRADGLLRTIERRAPRLGAAVEGLFALAGAALFAVLFYGSTPFLVDSWRSNEYAGVEGYVTFPIWPVRLVILAGAGLACLQFVFIAWQQLRRTAGRRSGR
jgi:TRAP-type C4-dicarboxylate transport system permease small subunit